MSNVSIYACGGAGTNIIQNSLDLGESLEMPNIDISIIDTSQSNIRVNLDKEKIGYTFVDGLTGGGKDQRFVFEHAKSYVNEHLNKNKPGDFNVVLFSLSGASGSSTGALITAELLKRKLPVVCFIVGSVEDGKQASNTFNSLRTLQNLSKSHGMPLTIAYHENVYGGENKGRTGEEEFVNDAIFLGIRDLCRLVSEHHHGLDREDIKNWLYFNKVSDITGLVELFTSDDVGSMSHVEGKVITSASLLRDATAPVPNLLQPYSCKGYVSDAMANELGDEFTGFHYLITRGFIKGVYNRVKMKVSEYEEALAKLQSSEDDLDDDFAEGDDPFKF